MNLDQQALLDAINHFRPDDVPPIDAALNIIANQATSIAEYEDQRRQAFDVAMQLVAILSCVTDSISARGDGDEV